MRFIVYPYKMSSMSSRYLAQALNTFRVYPDRNYRPRQDDVIINWGNSRFPEWYNNPILNNPDKVGISCNKLSTFLALDFNGVSIPEFTTNINEAKQWDGVVVCRTTLAGHGGRGIVLARSLDEIVPAPLYTKHVRHEHEFRVHVMNGAVIDFASKQRPTDGRPLGEELVRNHDNGWVFNRCGINLPEDAKIQAIRAVKALGLDFGAVDVAYRERENKAFVLEINTAPGFERESTTLQRYVTNFISNYGG